MNACLMNEHEDDSHVTEWGSWEERKGIGMVKKQISECPIHC